MKAFMKVDREREANREQTRLVAKNEGDVLVQ